MLSNLKMPFSTKLSAMAVKEITFYNKINDQMLFSFNDDIVIYCNVALRCVGLNWKLFCNMYETVIYENKADIFPNYTWKIAIPKSILKSGFYDIRVDVDVGNGEKIDGICTFGFDIENMCCSSYRREDFFAFWGKGLDKLSNIPLNACQGNSTFYVGAQINDYNVLNACLPFDYDAIGKKDDCVESFKISFDSILNKRIYGWIAKPKIEGRLPAILILPGAGCGARPRPLEHARHGYIALDIQVHGYDVDLVEYPEINYSKSGCINPEENLYYAIYLHCIKAIDYLCSRDDVDINKIIVMGGSQGGRLSIATAALDKRIKAVVAGITHYANLPYLLLEKNQKEDNAMVMGSEEVSALSYYDVLNFAPDVKCAVLMNFGLIDRVSPATCVYSVYKLLGSNHKKIVPLSGTSHDWSAEFDRTAWKWLDGVE